MRKLRVGDMFCECCEKDENGNWKRQPCCHTSGLCDAGDGKLGMCIHCGGEMFKENGLWWHHTQKDIPIQERGTIHSGE